MDDADSDQPAPRRRLRRLAYLLVAMAAGMLAVLLWTQRAHVPLLERLDRLCLDAQLHWRGPSAPGASVLIVSIDDRSLQRLGMPDRRQLAAAVDALAAGRPRAIALDLLLLERGRPGAASADDDAELARALRAAGPVLLPFALPAEPAVDGRAPPPVPAAIVDQAFMRHAGAAAQREVALEPRRLVAPPAALADAVQAGGGGLGHVTVPRASDGTVRYDLPALSFDDEVYPSLALRIAAVALGIDWRAVELRFGDGIRLGASRRVALDAQSRQWLNYYGPSGMFETIAFVDLLEGRVAPTRLRGRIVLVGQAALGSGDMFATPFDAGLSGVERLATAVDNIVEGRVLERPAWGPPAEIAAMLLLPLAASVALARWRPRWALLYLGLLAAALLELLQLRFELQRQFVAPLFPALALLLGCIGALALRSGFEQHDRRQMLARLRASEQRYALAAQGANDGLWDWDIAGDSVWFSARWLALMSLEREQAQGMQAWTSQLDLAGRHAFDAALADHLAGHSQQFHHLLGFRQGGVERWLLARGVATRDAGGQALRMAGSLTDVSEQQTLQRQITFDALHDRLTGLPNRALLRERLTQLMQQTPREVGVVLVDIDGFRALNEREGTAGGDAVLIELAHRLAQRQSDDGSVQPLNTGRLEADRFAILFSGALGPGGVDDGRLAAWALAQFQLPFAVGAQQLTLTASVGWAHGAHGPTQVDELLNAAEQALGHAKAQRRGQVHVYDPAEQLVENKRRWLKEHIDLALQREEFRLHYQPLVRLVDRQLLGFEALIRWPHPSRGMIMPGEFIGYAEQSGQIVPMGRWALMEVARQLVDWDAAGFRGEIAVNLSSAQFSEGDLEADAREVLKRLGPVSPRRIKLEVTESMAMANPQLTATALQALAALGFKISIDDFGTGYSSLAYLHRFPFDTLKIDRSFVMRLGTGREAVEIVRTIVGLALALDKQVLAEGVEEEAQARLLEELGVHVGQGWLFAKALPAEQAEALVRGSVAGTAA